MYLTDLPAPIQQSTSLPGFYARCPPWFEQLAASAAGVVVLVIVNVAATVVVLKTVVAGTKNVFVRVLLLPVTVTMPKAMPLLTVTVGVVTTV